MLLEAGSQQGAASPPPATSPGVPMGREAGSGEAGGAPSSPPQQRCLQGSCCREGMWLEAPYPNEAPETRHRPLLGCSWDPGAAG